MPARLLLTLTCILMLLAHPAVAADASALWVYCSVNFQVNKNVDDLIALLKRAKAAGYTAAANDADVLPGGGFENAEKQRPAGWDWCDGFGATSALDSDVKHAGRSSLRMGDFKKSNEHGNGRFAKKITLRPFTEYRATLWVKTAIRAE